MGVTPGDVVTFHYTGSFEDGTVFDSSREREPLRSVIGAGGLIAGFEEGILGMEVGEQKQIVVPPEKGYGPRDPNLVQAVPRSAIQVEDLEVGDVLQLREPDGGHVHHAFVAEITEESITLDLNLPLAGKTLIFDLEVLKIETAP